MITDDDIRRALAPNAFQAGSQYQMERRVQDLRIAADGATIDAWVLGSSRSPYHQSVRLLRAPNGKLLASGSCTCTVGYNCKHVAAVLFEYQQQAPAVLTGPVLRPSVLTPSEAPLPFEVDAWLHSLDAAQEEESEDYL